MANQINPAQTNIPPTVKCQATANNGTRCNAYAVGGSAYCFQHHPALAAQRRQARSKGGRARHGRTIGPISPTQPAPLDTMADVVALLQWAINQTRQLENSLHRNNTIGTIAAQLMKAFDVATLEGRLAEVEHILKSRGDFS